MGPAYLDYCSSWRRLSTLLYRSPVLQATSLLDILKDAVDQAVSTLQFLNYASRAFARHELI